MEIRVMDAVEDYVENCAHVKWTLRFWNAGKRRGLSKVRHEVVNKKRQQYFPALRHIREAEPLRGKQKTRAGQGKWCTAGGCAKRVA